MTILFLTGPTLTKVRGTTIHSRDRNHPIKFSGNVLRIHPDIVDETCGRRLLPSHWKSLPSVSVHRTLEPGIIIVGRHPYRLPPSHSSPVHFCVWTRRRPSSPQWRLPNVKPWPPSSVKPPLTSTVYSYPMSLHLYVPHIRFPSSVRWHSIPEFYHVTTLTNP